MKVVTGQKGNGITEEGGRTVLQAGNRKGKTLPPFSADVLSSLEQAPALPMRGRGMPVL